MSTPDAAPPSAAGTGGAAPDASIAPRDAESVEPRDAAAPDAPTAVDAAQPKDTTVAGDDAGTVKPGPGVVFEVTTKPLPSIGDAGSSYAPRNIAAIWVEDSSGRPIRVLAVFAYIMRRRLVEFSMRFPNLFTLFPQSMMLPPDVISRATRAQHGLIRVTWNLTDMDGNAVPDGDYVMLVEDCDRNDRSALLKVPFELRGRASTVTVPEGRDFGPAVLYYDP